ncbi:MAG: acetate kinase [Gammaproteobacteria bacterium BRH_c0]|nr:MAG: acetate kinase [Gammaproteobacteria bacterium BRH_c0]
MNILVFNAGSSSLKYQLIESASGTALLDGLIERIGAKNAREIHRRQGRHITDSACRADNHGGAFQLVHNLLQQHNELRGIDAIGHRVVHGGDIYDKPVLVDNQVLASIEGLNALAPLHNPPCLAVMRECQQHFSSLPQVAVFDTAFHQQMPDYARRYAVPDHWYRQYRIRRYGFHGISHHWMAQRAAEYLDKPLPSLKLITLHLGNGASISAIDGGRSVDTSMGMTPLEGLVMGTRSGDIDPAAVFHLGRETGLDMAQLESQLNNHSGLAGLCGVSDMREVIARRAAGDADAHLALEIYCYRIRKYIGAYFAVLGGADALIFSGGVGENAEEVRAMACGGLEILGIRIDPARNTAVEGAIARISAPAARVTLLVVAANEEQQIAREVSEILNPSHSASTTDWSH